MQRRFTKGQKRSEQHSDLLAEIQLLPKSAPPLDSAKWRPVKAAAYKDRMALENGSIDSSEFSSNPSFGSCDEVDSYVNASISGLLSEDDVSSHLADDPAYAKAKNKTGKLMKGLPRFTVNTTRTRALLGAQPVSQKKKKGHEHLDHSSFVKTPPLTPNSSEIISVYSQKLNQAGFHNTATGPVTNRLPLEEFNQQIIIPSSRISNSIRIHKSTLSNVSGDASLTSTETSSSDPAHNSKSWDMIGLQSKTTVGCSKATLEVELWKEILMNRVSRLGPHDLEIAKGLNELGAAHIRNKQHTEALAVYKKAARILRQHYGDQSLAVAHALDKVGLAASLCPTEPISPTSSTHVSENLEWGLVALKEAFKIRLHFLGPWHVDVVDTLNNLAGIYLRRSEKDKAYDAYLQVLIVRIAIFGKNHASVAVTAQTLGTLSMTMTKFNEAMNYFKVCLRIYRQGMNLKDNHPLVLQTFKRMDKTQQLMSCTKLGVNAMDKS